jgi:hypothetical protein
LSNWPFSTIRACLPDEPVQVAIDAVLQIDAQRDGADIEMMIQRHLDGFEDFLKEDRHSQILCIALKIFSS